MIELPVAPTKINLASLGNLVPHLHWHIVARFDWDSHFPQPVWGAAQRVATQVLSTSLAQLDRAVADARHRGHLVARGDDEARHGDAEGGHADGLGELQRGGQQTARVGGVGRHPGKAAAVGGHVHGGPPAGARPVRGERCA